jgi:hypothetical protein
MPYDLVKSRIEELNGERVVLAATLADKKFSGISTRGIFWFLI